MTRVIHVVTDYVALSENKPCTSVYDSGRQAHDHVQRLIRRYDGWYERESYGYASISICTVVEEMLQ